MTDDPYLLFTRPGCLTGVVYPPRQVTLTSRGNEHDPADTEDEDDGWGEDAEDFDYGDVIDTVHTIWLPWTLGVSVWFNRTTLYRYYVVASNRPITGPRSQVKFLPLPHFYEDGAACRHENDQIVNDEIERYQRLPEDKFDPLECNAFMYSSFLVTPNRYYDCDADVIPEAVRPLHRHDVRSGLMRWSELDRDAVLSVPWGAPGESDYGEPIYSTVKEFIAYVDQSFQRFYPEGAGTRVEWHKP